MGENVLSCGNTYEVSYEFLCARVQYFQIYVSAWGGWWYLYPGTGVGRKVFRCCKWIGAYTIRVFDDLPDCCFELRDRASWWILHRYCWIWPTTSAICHVPRNCYMLCQSLIAFIQMCMQYVRDSDAAYSRGKRKTYSKNIYVYEYKVYILDAFTFTLVYI